MVLATIDRFGKLEGTIPALVDNRVAMLTLISSKNVDFQENLKSPQIQKKENSILGISLFGDRVGINGS